MASGRVRGTTERDETEFPLLSHLTAMGWRHVRGPDVQKAEGRSYEDVLLENQLVSAIRRINVLPGDTKGWMTEADALQVVHSLRTKTRHATSSNLPEVNEQATGLFLHGELLRGHDDRDVKAHYVDWSAEALEGTPEEVLARNDFLVVDQLRVRNAEGKDAVLDLVLFVNGIPVVVIECKSPDLRDPLTLAVRDLRAYTGRPLLDDDRPPGAAPRRIPGFFAPVQLLIAADGRTAALGTPSSDEEHYALWRSVQPDYDDQEHLRRELRGWGLLDAGQPPTLQQQLTAVVLKPRNLLNILRHYVFVMPLKSKKQGSRRTASPSVTSAVAPKTAKVVCRHQQYRATERIIHKLRTGRTLLDGSATRDERGGVIWHTQGAGKSFTMMFLARRLHMSRDPELNQITVVAVTDRKDLQRQLRNAVRLSGSTVREGKSQQDLAGMLKRAGKHGGRAVIFATIQKFLGELVPGAPGDKGAEGPDTAGSDDRALAEDFEAARARIEAGEDPEDVADPAPSEETLRKATRVFPECSTSPKVVVLVDEAHRSHTSVLHACLRNALPNAARIGFTGTPLMHGRLTDTGRIFGLEPAAAPHGRPGFLDEYRMAEAERDKVVLPIRYEGRAATAEVRDGRDLDELFEDLIEPLEESERHQVRERYATPSDREVAESVPLIRRKAADMLAHYVRGPLRSGFKAQVAAVSRRAAVLYRHAFRDARAELLQRVRDFEDEGGPARLRCKSPDTYTSEELTLLHAWHQQATLRRIDFVPVISAGSERKSGLWQEWTDETRQRDHIDRFLEPLPETPPDNPWNTSPLQEPNPVRSGGVGDMNPWSDLLPHGAAQPAPPPIAILIVKSMLLTGFDAPLEQALYLDRPIRDAELLQAIARVNRPAREKKQGLVVDYYGVLNHLGVTLAAYRNDPPVTEQLHDRSTEDRRAMQAAAEAMREFLDGAGITEGSLSTRSGFSRAMLALGTPQDRVEFDRLLEKFVGAVERVLPHQSALRYVPDVRTWSLLQLRVRRHYRDAPGGGFSLSGYGRQVRALIADHLDVQEVEQTIPPVSILAPDFDETVGRLTDVEEAAAEQVHALRYHLQERIEHEDRPVHRKLSEELEKVLARLEGQWEDIKREVGPLIERARQAEAVNPDLATLSPTEQRLHQYLAEKLADDPRFEVPAPDRLAHLVSEVHGVIVDGVSRAAYVAEDAYVRTQLETHIWQRLRRSGLQPLSGGHGALEELAGNLVGYATQHQAEFRREGRGQ